MADSPSDKIDARIDELGDWRGDTLALIRTLIKKAVPDVTEEWKWRGVPTWYHDGMICTGETYKDKVKVTSPRAPHSMILRVCSTRVWAATPGERSTSLTATTSTRTLSWH